ncbi:AraC family transcriptional regulator [Paenibacillus sp. IB182496]|uniref:AraC family transcriptional regulator n=1 Tax=Paenibacillus sabuli TaxID=2772509 RepID=A0A927BTR5_9BACL|nr:AraC family transcriptional regulator [Paenibacillus sabuli]MBD2846643.1 AraC family transcriptional regulator [Paenibacillus sabuli]
MEAWLQELEGHYVVGLTGEPYREVAFYARPPGWEMEAHLHEWYQLIFVADGSLELTTGGRRHLLGRGQCALIPPGCIHALRTPAGYRQIGINLRACRDARGIVEMLDAHARTFAILERPQWHEAGELLWQEGRALSPRSRLQLVHTLDGLLLSATEPEPAPGRADPFQQALVAALRARLAAPPALEELCAAMRMSGAHLERRCRQCFGCGVIALFNRIRLDEACLLLRTSTDPVETIGRRLGFYDAAHFSRFFKRKLGLSPLHYRKRRS